MKTGKITWFSGKAEVLWSQGVLLPGHPESFRRLPIADESPSKAEFPEGTVVDYELNSGGQGPEALNVRKPALQKPALEAQQHPGG